MLNVFSLACLISIGGVVFILLARAVFFAIAVVFNLLTNRPDKTGHCPKDYIINSVTGKGAYWKDIKATVTDKEPIIAKVIVFNPTYEKNRKFLLSLKPGDKLVTAVARRKEKDDCDSDIDDYLDDDDLFNDDPEDDCCCDTTESDDEIFDDDEKFYNSILNDYEIRIVTNRLRQIGQLFREDAEKVAQRFDYITKTEVESITVDDRVDLKVKIMFD